MKKLIFIPLILFLTACPSNNDPHTHKLWIKCEESKNTSNLTPENFMVEFTITHTSRHMHQDEDQLKLKEEELSKVILWRNNFNYSVKPYFSGIEVSMHINEQTPSRLTPRNIQYHINRNTLSFDYAYTRSDVKTSLTSGMGGIKTINAGKCRHISSPTSLRSL